MSKVIQAKIAVQGTEVGSEFLLDFMTKEVATKSYKRISACAAYATYKGTVLLRSLLLGQNDTIYRWLIGLDDTFTDPKALRVAMQTYGAETRIVELESKGKRFHPKAYLLDSNEQGTATLIIGSCNLTEAALTKNCEVYAACYANTASEVERLRDYWDMLWKIGRPVTEEKVVEYETRFKAARVRNPVIEAEKSTPASRKVSKAVSASVSSSTLAWIELGSNTGGGNQLDIVKALAPFLSLTSNARQGTTQHLPIKSKQGTLNYQLTFTKGMWRFMNLQQGFTSPLRPKADSPSPYLLIIKRASDGELSMRIILRDNDEAKNIMALSAEIGFVGSSVAGSSGRRFGWH
jgi:HKD family nuclease